MTLGFRDPRQTVGRGLRETVMTHPRKTYRNLGTGNGAESSELLITPNNRVILDRVILDGEANFKYIGGY
ncbi:MAG: hypothetical protein QXU08_07500 [Ignisphaera sp.]